MEKYSHRTEKPLLDVYMQAFKEDNYPFTKFGQLAGEKGFIFDLSFAEEGNMLVHMKEIDEDTVQAFLYDIVPYRQIHPWLRQKTLDMVNTALGENSLHFHEEAQRFCMVLLLERGYLEENEMLGVSIRRAFCEAGEEVAACFTE